MVFQNLGNREKNEQKDGTSMADCLVRLRACLQRNEELVCLLQNLINDKVDQHPDLEAGLCQSEGDNFTRNEGSACQPLDQLLAEVEDACEPSGSYDSVVAKSVCGHGTNVDESSVFPQVPVIAEGIVVLHLPEEMGGGCS